jgi:hypothetical protein
MHPPHMKNVATTRATSHKPPKAKAPRLNPKAKKLEL